jgi:hypothetical protein
MGDFPTAVDVKEDGAAGRRKQAARAQDTVKFLFIFAMK